MDEPAVDRPHERLHGRRIGPHLALGPGLPKAAERARAIGATAVQVFGDNPTAWRRRTEPPAGADVFRERLAHEDIGPVAIHASYLVNLAGGNEEFWERSIANMAHELRFGAHYAARFVNVHIGSHLGRGRDAGLERLGTGIRRTLEAVGDATDAPRLVLENSAGGGDGLGSTLEELALILEAAVSAGSDASRLGFCLDTAHLWGAGFEISRPDVLDGVLADFDRLVGPEMLAMVHLNDSRSPLGSRTDRHEHIGAGLIGAEGLRHVVCHPRLAAVPMYLETPGMDLGYDGVNMERVRLLLAGEPLPDLPPEAFEAKSSRSRTPPPAATRRARSGGCRPG